MITQLSEEEILEILSYILKYIDEHPEKSSTEVREEVKKKFDLSEYATRKCFDILHFSGMIFVTKEKFLAPWKYVLTDYGKKKLVEGLKREDFLTVPAPMVRRAFIVTRILCLTKVYPAEIPESYIDLTTGERKTPLPSKRTQKLEIYIRSDWKFKMGVGYLYDPYVASWREDFGEEYVAKHRGITFLQTMCIASPRFAGYMWVPKRKVKTETISLLTEKRKTQRTMVYDPNNSVLVKKVGELDYGYGLKMKYFILDFSQVVPSMTVVGIDEVKNVMEAKIQGGAKSTTDIGITTTERRSARGQTGIYLRGIAEKIPLRTLKILAGKHGFTAKIVRKMPFT